MSNTNNVISKEDAERIRIAGPGEVTQPVSPQPLHVAEKILLDSADIIRKRLKEHGHTSRSFTLAAELWTSYVKHAFTIRGKTELLPHDVAMMMSLLKSMRVVYGFSEDNFVDGVGYTALAAMLHPDMKEPS